jgi:hypothetical protein
MGKSPKSWAACLEEFDTYIDDNCHFRPLAICDVLQEFCIWPCVMKENNWDLTAGLFKWFMSCKIYSKSSLLKREEKKSNRPTGATAKELFGKPVLLVRKLADQV